MNLVSSSKDCLDKHVVAEQKVRVRNVFAHVHKEDKGRLNSHVFIKGDWVLSN